MNADPSAEAGAPPQRRAPASGIVPSQMLRRLIDDGQVRAESPIGEEQVQPASIDLRLGQFAYRVRASFMPGPGATVQEKIDRFAMHRIDLSGGAVLERGCVYIVPLQERLHLDPPMTGVANPKSSIGRLDIFTRLITDHATEFERVRPGYRGPLYIEISPRTFSVVVRTGSRLNQLRLRRGAAASSDSATRRLHRQVGLVDGEQGHANIANGLALSVDLNGPGGDERDGSPIGFKARKHAGLIDVDMKERYDPLDFWEPIHAQGEDGIILNPDDFYILASKEAVTIPPDHAAEMVAYDTLVGEFRVHYAGFFDPAFGYTPAGGAQTRAVLEVRSHEVPFLLQDGQIVGRLIYERMLEEPDKLYGAGIGSSYQRQGLKLGKQFRPWP